MSNIFKTYTEEEKNHPKNHYCSLCDLLMKKKNKKDHDETKRHVKNLEKKEDKEYNKKLV